MAGKKPTGNTFEQERAASNGVAPSQRPMPLTQAVPPLDAKPITLESDLARGGEDVNDDRTYKRDIARTLTKLPRLRKIILWEPVAFDHSSMSSKEIDVTSEFYAQRKYHLDFGEFLGRICVIFWRTRSTGEEEVFRFPLESIVCFTTFDDNPGITAPKISVNEIAKPAATRS